MCNWFPAKILKRAASAFKGSIYINKYIITKGIVFVFILFYSLGLLGCNTLKQHLDAFLGSKEHLKLAFF